MDKRKMYLVFLHKYGRNQLFLLSMVIAILFASCILENTSSNLQETSNQVDEINCDVNWLETSSTQLYFPPNIFSDDPEHNQFVVDWYTSYLQAMKESSLYGVQKSPNIEIYRFLVIPTGFSPKMIRLQRCDNKYLLVKKQVTGNTKENPGIVKEQKERKLSEIEWRQCMSYLEAIRFWTLPLDQKEVGPNDGIQWVLEGVKKGKYHIIERHTPSAGFTGCYYYLSKLADSIDDKENMLVEKN